MVVEIPTPAELARASSGVLNLAWDIAVQLTKRFRVAVDDQELDEREITDEYWARAQQQLGNAVTLLQQGFELALKAKIATVSPLLLIANSAADLPRNRPGGTPFSDFRTIDAKDLIRVHDVFADTPITDSFKTMFEENRRLRNQFIHGVLREGRISETKIYSDVLKGFTLLQFSGKTWPQTRIEYLSLETSESTVAADDLAWGKVIAELDLVVSSLPRKVLLEHLGFDKRARRYLCPARCYFEMLDRAFRDFISQQPIALAQLVPCTPESTTVHCVICGKDSPVVRRPCSVCSKSNVLAYGIEDDPELGICLVCNAEQRSNN